MVRGVVAGLQEVLQQEPAPAEVPAVVQTIQEPQVNQVVNTVQENQQQLASTGSRDGSPGGSRGDGWWELGLPTIGGDYGGSRL